MARVSRLPAGDLAAFLAQSTFVAPAPDLRLEVNGGTVSLDGSWGAPAVRFDLLGSVTVQGTDGPDGVTTAPYRRWASTRLDPTGSASVLPDGSTTYPNGNWLYLVDPSTNRLARPNWIDFIYDRTIHGA